MNSWAWKPSGIEGLLDSAAKGTTLFQGYESQRDSYLRYHIRIHKHINALILTTYLLWEKEVQKLAKAVSQTLFSRRLMEGDFLLTTRVEAARDGDKMPSDAAVIEAYNRRKLAENWPPLLDISTFGSTCALQFHSEKAEAWMISQLLG